MIRELPPTREENVPTPSQLKDLIIVKVSPAMKTIVSTSSTKDDSSGDDEDGLLDDEEDSQRDETEVD